MTAALAIADLATGYGKKPVLTNATLAVAEGSMVGLLGANGAGKSTLLNCIAGLLPAWSGRVLLHGEDVTRLATRRRVARRLALVPQGGLVFGSLSVRENLQVACSPNPLTLDEILAIGCQILPDLDRRLDQSGASLSGGQRQIVAILRALAEQPRVLLLDEPSVGLAPQALLRVLTLIDGVRRRNGLTVLVAEQNKSVVAACTERYLVDGGSVRPLAGDGLWISGENHDTDAVTARPPSRQ